VRDVTEWIGFDHVEHRLDNFGFEENRNQLLTICNLQNSYKEGLKKLHRTDSVDSNFLNLFVGLVNVADIARLLLP
jgi:hypothetical protein